MSSSLAWFGKTYPTFGSPTNDHRSQYPIQEGKALEVFAAVFDKLLNASGAAAAVLDVSSVAAT